MEWKLSTMDDTHEAARFVAARLRPGDCIALEGEMGAGKTTFVRALAEALGCRQEATSPTFALANRYDGRLTLWHLDLYRLRTEEELEDIGIEEYVWPEEGATVIEWPQLAAPWLDDALRFAIRTEVERTLVLPDSFAERSV